jgi:peptidoglycan glycosyltransferase
VNRSIRRLYLTLAAGFGLLMLMLGYWQVVAADGLKDRPGNEQTAQAQRLVDRGRIVSADGKIMAASRAVRVKGQKVFERLYPQGDLAAQTIGYTSAGATTGLERTYDRYLSGSFGTEPLLQRLNLSEKEGANVHIGLDTRVQTVAQEQLSSGPGAVVALEPRTGKVIAMASSPTFDLQQVVTPGGFDAIASQEGGPLLNRTVQGLYPPGSSFKTVTASEALESGLYTPDSEFPGGSEYETPGGPIENFGGSRFGPHTLTTALTFSINTTFAEIGDALGAERMGEIMTAYGFGERPPVDLPEVAISGRRSGDEVLPNDDPDEDTARLAIGQEQLAVTPVQMAMVAGAIANGGTAMAPRLMTRIVDRGGSLVQRGEPEELGQVMSPSNAAELASMMEDVVREGTGTRAALSGVGVTVAGKTGTAESDDPSRNQAWFIGFAPAEDPQVAVAVVIEDTALTGGEAAAPVAAAVMDSALQVGP